MKILPDFVARFIPEGLRASLKPPVPIAEREDPVLFDVHQKEQDSLLRREVAWSEESAIYSPTAFVKYNPDDLIGKKGYGIYRKILLDEQVKAVTRFRRDAITSRDYFFEIDNKDMPDEERARRIGLSEHIVKKARGSFTDNMNGILSGVYHGFSLTEKVYRQVEYEGLTFWGIDRLKLKPFDTFEFDVDQVGEVRTLRQNLGGKDQKLKLGKFIHFVQNPEYDEHYGASELRECYRPWFSKDIAWKYRNIWLEKHANGYKWVEPKENHQLIKGTPEYTNLQNVLSNTVTGAGMIFGNGIEFHLEFPANQVAFKEAIEDADLGIARALLVPNLMGITPSGQTGSFSQSNTQLEAFLWTLDADAGRLAESLNEQLFRELGEINFGDDDWPRLKFKPVSKTKMFEMIKAWGELVKIKVVTPSIADEEHVRDLMDMPPKADEEDELNTVGNEDGNIDGDGSEGDGEDAGEIDGLGGEDQEETIIGRASATITAAAFTKALSRVDFAVIARNSTSIQDDYVPRLGAIVADITDDLIIKHKANGSPDEAVSKMKKTKVDRGLNTKLQRTYVAFIKESFKLGQKHAEIEIDKAMGESFSTKFDRERITFISDDYFNIRSFKGANALSDDAKVKIEQIILNGSKYGKTWREMETEIYEQFATEGLITVEQAREALGYALDVDNPAARLRTIVRTNSFDAINEARYEYFTDPGLDGFVQGFEYSAILDSRTTQICKQLDGTEHPMDWWEANANYRPPNHFNCRSLLVPVTQLDTLDESVEPTIEPQKGFG